jgi:hypothetical protein
VYFAADSRAKFTYPDGKSEVIEGKAGQSCGWIT